MTFVLDPAVMMASSDMPGGTPPQFKGLSQESSPPVLAHVIVAAQVPKDSSKKTAMAKTPNGRVEWIS